MDFMHPKMLKWFESFLQDKSLYVDLNVMNKPPDLLNILDEWLGATYGPDQKEWYVARFNKSLQTASIGMLCGGGWIFYVRESSVESFQNPVWGDEGGEDCPLQVSDPQFFTKLKGILTFIEGYRERHV